MREIFDIIINAFTVTFDEINESLLNKVSRKRARKYN